MSGKDLQDATVFPWPAVGAWAAMSAGYLIARHAPLVQSVYWFGACACAALAAMALRGHRAALIALAIAAVFGGAGYFSWRLLDPPNASRAIIYAADDPAALLRQPRAIVSFEAVVLSHPEHAPSQTGLLAPFIHLPPVTRFRAQATRVIDGRGESDIRGLVYVTANAKLPNLKAGDRVRLTGFLRPIRGASNPGAYDSLLWARQVGALGFLQMDSAGIVEPLSQPQAWTARLFSAAVRAQADFRALAAAWLDTSTARDLSHDHAAARAVAGALLLGAREDAAMHDLDAAMRRIGVAHVLAISGFHLSVLVFFAVLTLRVLGVRGGLELALVAAVVVLYMTLTPARTPILRAGVMALAFLGAEAIGRRYHPLSVLSWTAIAILLWRPLDLWSPGFQLSFGVVAAIVSLPKLLQQRLNPLQPPPDEMTRARWMRHYFQQMLLVGVCAWIVATPIIIHHFGMLSIFGALVSIAVFPFVLVIIGAGAAVLLLASLLPSAASLLGAVLMFVGDVLVKLTLAIDALPLTSMHVPPVSLWWSLAALCLSVWLLVKPSRFRWRDAALIALLIAWLAGFGIHRNLERNVALRIDTLDVGDGACHLIRSGRDAILWDAGSQRLSVSEWELPQAFRALGAWPVRRIVLSHPNLDHYSAIPDLAAPLGVREVLLEQATIAEAESDPSGPVAFLLKRLRREGVAVRVIAAGDLLRIGSATMEFLHPPPGEQFEASNDSSLTALLSVPTAAGVRTALFCGDIERNAIAAIRKAHPELRADVMEAPHHGSARPPAIAFVRDVEPRVVIQSTGPQRANDNRWDEVRAGRQWFTTATDGWVSIRVRTDGAIDASSIGAGRHFISAAETATGTAR